MTAIKKRRKPHDPNKDYLDRDDVYYIKKHIAQGIPYERIAANVYLTLKMWKEWQTDRTESAKIRLREVIQVNMCIHGNYHCYICEVMLLQKVIEEYQNDMKQIAELSCLEEGYDETLYTMKKIMAISNTYVINEYLKAGGT